jgi:hypothetical protein
MMQSEKLAALGEMAASCSRDPESAGITVRRRRSRKGSQGPVGMIQFIGEESERINRMLTNF